VAELVADKSVDILRWMFESSRTVTVSKLCFGNFSKIFTGTVTLVLANCH
jgi:hypothetical protein